MIFENKHSNKPKIKMEIKINIDDTPIQQVDTTKFLGLLTDSNLSWNSHSQHVSKIVSKYNGIICKVRKFLPLHSLKTFYNSLILPHLSYGAMIWADSNNSIIDSVFLLQNRLIRFCTKSLWLLTLIHFSHVFPPSRYRTSINFSWLLLCINFTINYFPLISSATISSMLIHSYDARHAHEPFITTTNTVLASNTSKSQGPQLWFQLPSPLIDVHL